jgi:hypothetical protein
MRILFKEDQTKVLRAPDSSVAVGSTTESNLDCKLRWVRKGEDHV